MNKSIIPPLTIFAIPKAFKGHTAIIQQNAIRSWAFLSPKPKIILLGDDQGTAEMAREFGLIHITEIKRNERGTPLVSSVFEKANGFATSNMLMYVNADILLLPNFMDALQAIQKEGIDNFVMSGQRHELFVYDPIDFSEDWITKILTRVKEEGTLDGLAAIDYLVFTKGLYNHIPPFAIGRPAWDNWMLWYARSQGADLINATKTVMVIHQNHDYRFIKGGPIEVWKGKECQQNRSLAEGQMMTLADATLVLSPKGLRKTKRKDRKDRAEKKKSVQKRIKAGIGELNQGNYAVALDHFEYALLRAKGKAVKDIESYRQLCISKLDPHGDDPFQKRQKNQKSRDY